MDYIFKDIGRFIDISRFYFPNIQIHSVSGRKRKEREIIWLQKRQKKELAHYFSLIITSIFLLFTSHTSASPPSNFLSSTGQGDRADPPAEQIRRARWVPLHVETLLKAAAGEVGGEKRCGNRPCEKSLLLFFIFLHLFPKKDAAPVLLRSSSDNEIQSCMARSANRTNCLH